MIGPAIPPEATPDEMRAIEFVRARCIATGLRLGPQIEEYVVEFLVAYIVREAAGK